MSRAWSGVSTIAILTVASVILVPSVPQMSAAAPTQAAPLNDDNSLWRMDVVRTDATGVILEVLQAPGDPAIEVLKGSRCPEFPSREADLHSAGAGGGLFREEVSPSWLIGVPEHGSSAVFVEVVDAQVLPLCLDKHIEPAAQALAAKDDRIVSLAPAGTLRGQPVSRVTVRMMAPVGDGCSVVLRTRVRFGVRYAHPESVSVYGHHGGGFAPLLSVLPNAEALPRRELRVGQEPLAESHQAYSCSGSLGGEADAAPGDPRALRIVVDRGGPFAVTGDDLAGAGWNLSTTDQRAISLEVAGVELPMQVVGGEDGSLDATDSVVFYGEAMDGLYTRENVYWLRPEGAGHRMGTRLVPPDRSKRPASTFRQVLHFEEDATYFASMRTEDPNDRWLWGPAIQAPATRDFTFNVQAPPGEADDTMLVVRLYGRTADASVTPDHRVILQLNGVLFHNFSFDGIGAYLTEVEVPQGTLRFGANTLTIGLPGGSGAFADAVALDWFEVSYNARFRSDGSTLEFGSLDTGQSTFALQGFHSPSVSLLDITDTRAPVLLLGAEIDGGDDSGYTLRFTDPSDGARRYLAFTTDAVRGPTRIERNAPSSLLSSDHGADYVVVTHPDFSDALRPLLARRRSSGLRVEEVLIQDIYDEFSFGVFDPRAIRRFLQYAYDCWKAPVPTYVLLVGESSLDYRGAYGTEQRNFVPSVQVPVEMSGGLGAVTSDLWFANLDSDERDVLPEVLLGRLSVSTSKQTEDVVSKILLFDDVPPGADWQRQVVMIADDDGGGAFEPFSESLIDVMPSEVVANRIYAARRPADSDISSDIRQAVHDGALVVNYVGHGNVDLWGPWRGGGFIFDNGDIAKLGNGAKLPLLTASTCMNGWIDHPLKPVSMAELWLTHSGGGGIAAWSPSGFTGTANERVLFKTLMAGLYDGRGLSIGSLTGEAIVAAHAEATAADDTIRQFILLGDPALVISGVAVASPSTSTPSATCPSTTPTASPSPTPQATERPRSRLFIPFSWRHGYSEGRSSRRTHPSLPGELTAQR